ncbi:MAG: FMN-binding protein [Desulfobacterales bacterium]
MSKRYVVILTAVLTILFTMASVSYGIVLLKPGKALKQVLGKKAEIVVETVKLKGDVLAKIKERLGGHLVDLPKGSESKKVRAKTKIDFHFSIKDGKKTRVAMFDSQPGKWGPVEFIIGLSMKGKIKKVKVMSYSEKRGRPVARAGFLRQFEGKSSKDRFIIGKDVTGISGATISVKSVAFAVKKAIVIYEEVYLNK